MHYINKQRRKNRTITREELICDTKAKELNENNDCSVKAIAILTGLSYSTVHAAFQAAGRKSRAVTAQYITNQAVQSLGYKLVSLGNMSFRGCGRPKWVQDIMSRYPKWYRPERLTTYQIKKFPQAWAHLPPLLIHVDSHHAAFKDGVVQDWSATKSNRILKMYMVEKTAT